MTTTPSTIQLIVPKKPNYVKTDDVIPSTDHHWPNGVALPCKLNTIEIGMWDNETRICIVDENNLMNGVVINKDQLEFIIDTLIKLKDKMI